ncbi:MAG: hypothetical protein WGN25_10165 [Candidatus Electrothrix sp. GW3-4]|uniref:hypothetical protein n=1 Tax=Candidatus Electrothrix sp. GW3-4 TaxID=3126740 RepID=UPI0030CA6303
MKQISVVVEEQPRFPLADITELMAANDINIDTIESETVGNASVIVMTVNKYDLALRALRDASFNAITEDCLLIKLKDEPGALAKIARKFKEADLHIRSFHIISRNNDTSIAAISTERTEQAMKLVEDILVS